MIVFYDACMLSEFLTNIDRILNKIARISQVKKSDNIIGRINRFHLQ